MAIVLKSSVSKQELTQIVLDGWDDMKRERSELEEKWKRCILAYLCTFDKKWVEYARMANRSHRYVGLSFDAIETLGPQIVDALVGGSDWLTLDPIRKGFSEEDDRYAENMTHYLRYQLRFGKYQKVVRQATRSILMLGNCPWSGDWKVKKAANYSHMNEEMEKWVDDSARYNAEHEEVMKQYEAASIQSMMLTGEQVEKPDFAPPPRPPRDLDIVYQGPVLRIGSIFNYVQEQHPNDEDGALRIMRSWRTKAYMKKMAEPDEDGYRLYENISGIHEINSEETSKDNEAEILVKSALGMEMPHAKDKLEIKEMHGTFELNSATGEKGLYENYVVTVANETLIRCEPSPMFTGRPLVQNARLIVPEGAVYGIGVLEKALDDQDSANAIHNQNIDAVNVVIQPELEIVEDQLVDGQMKRSGPGVHHRVTEKGTITPIVKNFQGIPLGFESLSASISQHERMTGATNTAGGSNESATRTARNSNIIATKLGAHVISIEDELITESLNMFLEMNAQYIDADQVFTITQDKKIVEIEIPVQQIQRGWIAYAAGSRHLAEKQERIQNLMFATQVAAQAKAQHPVSPINEVILYKTLFKEILGESGEIVMSEQEYQEEMIAYQQMVQAQQAQAAAQQGVQNGGNKQAGTQGSNVVDIGQAAGTP